MAIIGIEFFTEFSNFDKANKTHTQDLKILRKFTYSFVKQFLDTKKHKNKYFKYNDTSKKPEEIDLHDKKLGGSDDQWAETVDLFLIATHGNNDGGNIILLYDTMKNSWIGNSKDWRLGNTNVQLKWLLIFGCKTIDKSNVLGVLDVFENLHQICGAYDNITVPGTVYEITKEGSVKEVTYVEDVGDGIAKSLIDGQSVADSWIFGSYTSSMGILPLIVVAAERKDSWHIQYPKWYLTTLDNDHLSGAGQTMRDVSKTEKHWLSYAWLDKSTSLTEHTRGWIDF